MKIRILEAGLLLYPNVTITKIAEALSVSIPSVCYHFKASEINDAVEKYAVGTDNRQVIAQMITAKAESVAHISNKEKLKYLVDSV